MASKRKRKPWNVREPVARYSVRGVPCTMTAIGARSNSRLSVRHTATLFRTHVGSWFNLVTHFGSPLGVAAAITGGYWFNLMTHCGSRLGVVVQPHDPL